MSNRLATDVVSGEGLGVGRRLQGHRPGGEALRRVSSTSAASPGCFTSRRSRTIASSAVENVLSPGDELKVLILSKDAERSRLSLSTKKLEPSPGDMLRNPALVFEKAEEMGRVFRERVAAAEAAAQAEEGAAEELKGMAPSKSEDEDGDAASAEEA